MKMIDKFLYYCKDLPSPDTFKKLNYLFGVAACLGRKVWIGESYGDPIYPNIYVLFVGPPAVAKSLPAGKIKRILTSFEIKNQQTTLLEKAIKMHPDSATFESMLDILQKCLRSENRPYPTGKAIKHSSMAVILDTEFGLLIKEENRELVEFFTACYDCKESYHRTTKHCGENVILFPCINLLGCCTDGWLDEKLTSRIISTGFSSRLILAYSGEIREQELIFRCTEDQAKAMDEIRTYFEFITFNYGGPLKVTPEAELWAKELSNHILKNPTNSDKVLQHYFSRRKVHLMKMAILFHLSEPENKIEEPIGIEDFKQAHEFLLTLEPNMHKALKGGDKQNATDILGDKILTLLDKPLVESALYAATIKEVKEVEEIEIAMKYLEKAGKIKSQIVSNKRYWTKEAA